MSDIKLKRCPFCGGEAEIQGDGDCDISWSVTRVHIECCECAAEMHFTDMSAAYDEKRSSEMIPNAVAMWNSRAYESENAELKTEVEHYKNQLNLVCEEGLTPADAKKSHEANVGLAEENTRLKAKVAELEADIKNNKGGVFAYDANGEAWVRLGFKIVKDSEVNHENRANFIF